MASPKPLRSAPEDLPSIEAQLSALTLPHFTAADAWTIGSSLRTRILSLAPNTPAAINITLANSDMVYFHATTGPVNPDNDVWIARKRATVKRWGVSSWAMGRKFNGDEDKFASKFGLGARAGDYAIHGGAVPIRVKGVDGVVAVCVVSGLKQDQDHMLVVEALEALIAAESGNGTAVEGGSVESEPSTAEGKVMVDEQNAGVAVLAS